MSMAKRKMLPILSFRSIPGVDGGETMLTVHPPDDGHINRYSAWVGGCCVGTKPSMEEACELLLEQAKATCDRHMDEAKRKFEHYRSERNMLFRDGLTPR